MTEFRKGGSPETEAEFRSRRDANRKQTQEDIEKLPEARREMVKNLTGIFEQALVSYLQRPKAESLILNDIRDMLVQFSNGLGYAADAQGGQSRQDDLKAVLVGARMLFDPTRERRHDIAPGD